MEEVEGVKKKSKRKESRYGKRYGFEVKLRCVKLRLEEGVPTSLISKEVGASQDVIRRWARAYQERGEAGLKNRVISAGSQRKLPSPVREKIVEIKKREPLFGVKRISHLLKRAFFLSASPETVRRTLRAESLIIPSKKKHQHNLSRLRFFERSTPNQLWQGDIFTFRLGGRYAYLIGFIGDYSRYVVGLEMYRSQTADQVLEVYRRAVGEYGIAKEMLTDQGRQYTNWRGLTGSAAALSLQDAQGKATHRSLNLTLNGGVKDLLALRGLDLTIRCMGEQLSDVGPWVGGSLPELGRFDVKGHLTGSAAVLEVDGLSALVDQSDLNGSARVEFRKRPKITAILQSGFIELTPLMKLEKAEEKKAEEPSGRDRGLFSGEALPFNKLETVDLDITLNARNIRSRDAKWDFGRFALKFASNGPAA